MKTAMPTTRALEQKPSETTLVVCDDEMILAEGDGRGCIADAAIGEDLLRIGPDR